ncbi:MAG: glycosyltransferase family 2 protein [Anaerolineae bacterium]
MTQLALQEMPAILPELSELPATEQPDLTVVLPVYNEETAIATVIEPLLELLGRQLALSFEIIVVDDGSSDQSAARVMEMDHPQVLLHQHPYNIGNGAAIKTGIRRARGRYILMMDADGQHRVADIPRLLEQAGRYDMVVGARTRDSQTAFHRDLANGVYNLFASYVCGRPIADLTSGFRLIKASLARELVYLLPNTFSYPTTLTLAVIRAGYSLKYVPITVRRRVGRSKINPWVDGLRFLTILLRIAVFFSPLKVFVPISLSFFGLGFGWYLYRVFVVHTRFPPVSSLLMITSVLIFLIGLVSEQITYLRYERR